MKFSRTIKAMLIAAVLLATASAGFAQSNGPQNQTVTAQVGMSQTITVPATANLGLYLGPFPQTKTVSAGTITATSNVPWNLQIKANAAYTCDANVLKGCLKRVGGPEKFQTAFQWKENAGAFADILIAGALVYPGNSPPVSGFNIPITYSQLVQASDFMPAQDYQIVVVYTLTQ